MPTYSFTYEIPGVPEGMEAKGIVFKKYDQKTTLKAGDPAVINGRTLGTIDHFSHLTAGYNPKDHDALDTVTAHPKPAILPSTLKELHSGDETRWAKARIELVRSLNLDDIIDYVY